MDKAIVDNYIKFSNIAFKMVEGLFNIRSITGLDIMKMVIALEISFGVCSDSFYQ